MEVSKGLQVIQFTPHLINKANPEHSKPIFREFLIQRLPLSGKTPLPESCKETFQKKSTRRTIFLLECFLASTGVKELQRIDSLNPETNMSIVQTLINKSRMGLVAIQKPEEYLNSHVGCVVVLCDPLHPPTGQSSHWPIPLFLHLALFHASPFSSISHGVGVSPPMAPTCQLFLFLLIGKYFKEMARFLKYLVRKKTWQARIQGEILAKFALRKGQSEKGMRKEKMVCAMAGQR